MEIGTAIVVQEQRIRLRPAGHHVLTIHAFSNNLRKYPWVLKGNDQITEQSMLCMRSASSYLYSIYRHTFGTGSVDMVSNKIVTSLRIVSETSSNLNS